MLENLIFKELYLREDKEKRLREKGRGVHHFLRLKGIHLIEDYGEYQGVPDLILASRVKLSPKNYQFLKVVQIKSLLDTH